MAPQKKASHRPWPQPPPPKVRWSAMGHRFYWSLSLKSRHCSWAGQQWALIPSNYSWASNKRARIFVARWETTSKDVDPSAKAVRWARGGGDSQARKSRFGQRRRYTWPQPTPWKTPRGEWIGVNANIMIFLNKYVSMMQTITQNKKLKPNSPWRALELLLFDSSR